MVDPQTNLISGPTARWLLFSRIWLLGLFLLDMFTMLAFVFIDFSALQNPTWYVVMFIVIVAFATSNVYYGIVKRRELAHGYTTLPMDFPNIELRDPANGHVLNPAGRPLPDDFSLKRAREEYARAHGA